MGLVCTLKAAPSASPRVTSYQKFMARSILALLPLFDDHYSLVWSLHPEDYQHLLGLSDDQFLRELNRSL